MRQELSKSQNGSFPVSSSRHEGRTSREMLHLFPDITDTQQDAGQIFYLRLPASLAGRRFAYRHRYVCRNLLWCLLSAQFLSTNTHINGPIINSSSIYLHLTLNLFTYFHKTRYGRCYYRPPQCVTPQFTTSSNNNMVERRSCVTERALIPLVQSPEMICINKTYEVIN